MQILKFRLLFCTLLICNLVFAQEPPPPVNGGQGVPVPIDGGLTALLVAGGAMGYRAMKKKNEEV